MQGFLLNLDDFCTFIKQTTSAAYTILYNQYSNLIGYSQLSNIIGHIWVSSGYFCNFIGQDSVADILVIGE